MPMNPPPHPPTTGRAAMIAVVGRANVGKSSLVNRLLGEKISIVSPVAQTTRHVIRGIWTEPRGQLVFLDTPGIHKASYDLGRIMNRAARAAAEGVDLAMLVLDASTPPREEDEGWMNSLATANQPLLIVLNKTDKPHSYQGDYRKIWNKVAASRPEGAGPAWQTVSAQTGAGCPALLDQLFAMAPEGPALFPADVLSDFPRKLFIADVVREKLNGRLKEELPHMLAVFVDELDDAPAALHVKATIFVAKPSQKPILLGIKGRNLRAVRRAAEKELAAIYERPCKVELWIKVEKNWPRNHWMLQRLGYVE